MSAKDTLKRYIIFAFGLFFNAFGVAFITKASLGSSPLAAIPYTLSLIVKGFTYGNWVIVYNLIMITLQIIILKGKVNKAEIFIQIVISFCFGYCVDISMRALSSFLPGLYILKILSLLCGCVIIAFGAYLEVIANVAMLPADAFVRAIATVSGKEYGKIRVISDSAQTVVAAALCLIVLKKLSGVREGTVITAFLVGNIVRVMNKLLKPLKDFLLPEVPLTGEQK